MNKNKCVNYLENFCNSKKLISEEILGIRPTYDNQYDKYEIIGNGPINGLKVYKYGEFGNNVIQLINSVYLAEKWKLESVHVHDFGSMFFPGVHTTNSNLKIIINSSSSVFK